MITYNEHRSFGKAKRCAVGNKAVISKEEILEAAYRQVVQQGLASLSIRNVANACGISVGTVYHSFASKNELVNEVIARFWRETFGGIMDEVEEGPVDFIAFCRQLSEKTSEALRAFREGFLADLAPLNAPDHAVAHQREEQAFSHIRRGLRRALDEDERIDRKRLTGDLEPDRLCSLVWSVILQTARTGQPLDRTLLALLERELY